MKENRIDKREYFKFIAKRRIDKIYEQLRLIRNLSNTNNYSYTKEDLDYMFEELDKNIDQTKEKLYKQLDRTKGRFEWK